MAEGPCRSDRPPASAQGQPPLRRFLELASATSNHTRPPAVPAVRNPIFCLTTSGRENKMSYKEIMTARKTRRRCVKRIPKRAGLSSGSQVIETPQYSPRGTSESSLRVVAETHSISRLVQMASTMGEMVVAASPSPVPVLTLSSVTFGAGWRIKKDGGADYDQPEWLAGRSPVAYPYLYASKP